MTTLIDILKTQKGKSGRLALLSSSVLLLALFLLYAPVSLAGALVPAAFLVLVFQRGEEVSYILREAWPALAAFALLFVISALISDFPDRVSKASYDFMRGMMVFVLARHVAAAVPSRVFMALYVPLLGIALLVVLAGTLWRQSVHPQPPHWLWIVISDPALFVRAPADLVFWCLPALALLATPERDGYRYWGMTLGAPLLMVLLLLLWDVDQAALACLLGLFLLAVFWRGGPLRALFGVLLAGLALAIWSGAIPIGQDIRPLLDVWAEVEGVSHKERVQSMTWGAFLESPWLGFGAGTFKLMPFAAGYVHPYLVYLEVLASVGILGTLLLVWGVWRLTRVRVLLPSPPYYLRLGGLLLAYFLIRGGFDIRLFGFDGWFIVFAASGLMARSRGAYGRW